MRHFDKDFLENFRPFQPFPELPTYGDIRTIGYSCLRDNRIYRDGEWSGLWSSCKQLHGDLRLAELCCLEHEATLADDKVASDSRRVHATEHRIGPTAPIGLLCWPGDEPSLGLMGLTGVRAQEVALFYRLLPNSAKWTCGALIEALKADLERIPPEELRVRIYAPSAEEVAKEQIARLRNDKPSSGSYLAEPRFWKLYGEGMNNLTPSKIARLQAVPEKKGRSHDRKRAKQ